MIPLNLFYQEPNEDRWFPLDRYPRRIVRRLVRGPRRPGGQERVFLNLMAGLTRLGIPFRVNALRYARKNPSELCCVLGKRCMLDRFAWQNPLLIGPCIHDHPISDPDLFRRRRIRRILVPGEWMRTMCAEAWGDRVFSWPIGIDTDYWSPPSPSVVRDIDVLVYDKLRWDRERAVPELLDPVFAEIKKRRLNHEVVRYGHYDPVAYRMLLGRSRCMVFLCEHETQGLAYQEALSFGVPIIALDHGGAWKDPSYYPKKVLFSPVSSVPYWDDRCGVRFSHSAELPAAFDRLALLQAAGQIDPRSYIIENLTLEKCAARFVEHVREAENSVDATGV